MQSINEIIQQKFKNTINDTLPGFHSIVTLAKCLGDPYIAIMVSPNDYLINNVACQYPQVISFNFDIPAETLTVQCFGGCGGKSILLKPLPDSYLFCHMVDIPFRKSKGIDKSLLNLRKTLLKYKELLTIHQKDLLYQDYVDYTKILNNY